MGLIQEYLRKKRAKKEFFRQAQFEDRVSDTIETRKLSNDERVLNSYREEERQRRIKSAVKKITAQKNRELWSGKLHNPAYAPNVFHKNDNIFVGQQSIMKNDKNLFKGGLFFK